MARRNFLSVWPDECFHFEMFRMPLLMRTMYVCNSPDTVEKLFIEHHQSFERKSSQQRHALAPLLGDGLLISDGAVWKKRRRTVSPVVHASKLPSFAPVMIETATELVDKWRGMRAPTAIDAQKAMASMAAEIIIRAVFGRRLGEEYAAETIAAFAEYQSNVAQLDLPYFFGLPDWVPRYQPASIRRAARRIHDVLDRVIAAARAGRQAGETSVLSLLLDATDPETGQPLDAVGLRNEAATIFLAGHETTANSLAWCWYLLSQSPVVERRLHAELDSVLGGRAPTLADMPRLVYTRAIFEETIRLYPPIPILARVAVRAEKIRRYTIAPGSLVAVVPWLLQRHRKFWEQPDSFMPERFMPENAAKLVRHAHLPFSVGPRVCAGAAFGQAEAVLCIATLAQAVRLRLAPGAVVEPVCRLTLRPGEALPMVVEQRT
jgi:cytochrome P450